MESPPPTLPAPLKRVLVGVDFSPGSQKAVTEAMHLAEHLHAELRLAHAVTVPEVPPAVFAGSGQATAAWEKGLREHFSHNRKRIDVLAKECAQGNVKVHQMLVEGYPDTALVDAAYQRNSDLLVIGASGKGRKRRVGGLASRILRTAPCAVLIARSGKAAQGGYGHILVPSDFTESAMSALQTALAVVRPGGEIEVLHAYVAQPFAFPYFGPVPPSETGQPIGRDLTAELAREAERLGQELLASCPADRAAFAYRIVVDTPVNAILARLRDAHFDAVIMGSHGRRGVRRWVLGTVAEAVTDAARCSVIITHAMSGGATPRKRDRK
jgi:nucleotide-binding universal stress UspA family protein